MIKSTLSLVKKPLSVSAFKKPLAVNCQRLFLWILLIPFVLLSACNSFQAKANNYSIVPTDFNNSAITNASTSKTNRGISILSGYLIKEKSYNSFPITELSDLAWDEDEQLLYAISDEGLVYHLALKHTQNKVEDVNFVYAGLLIDKDRLPLKGKFSDSEGLTVINANNGISGDSQLIISFENKPRIERYTPKGQLIDKVNTVKKLRKRKYFRGNNKALESVIMHPTHGILTAAEKPLKAKDIKQQTLYSSTGKEWNFAASNIKNSAITAIEVLNNGDILILERAYNGILSPVVISLRQLKIQECDEHHYCKTELLAKLDSSEGWKVDNFEGLTHLQDNTYLMISDDNGNPLQKSILVLFEVNIQ